eukprot:12115384-Alexandrium_andersonii.AAC.1
MPQTPKESKEAKERWWSAPGPPEAPRGGSPPPRAARQCVCVCVRVRAYLAPWATPACVRVPVEEMAGLRTVAFENELYVQAPVGF